MEYQGSFRQLVVWQEGKKLTLKIYELTKDFPIEERFAMASQMRRAIYSFLSNIAEGNARKHFKDRYNFFNIARSSLIELDCFAEIAFELNYISQKEFKNITESINKCAYLINKFIKSQNNNTNNLNNPKDPKDLNNLN